MMTAKRKVNRRTLRQRIAIKKLEEFEGLYLFRRKPRHLKDGSMRLTTGCFGKDEGHLRNCVWDHCMDAGFKIERKVFHKDKDGWYARAWGSPSRHPLAYYWHGKEYFVITIPPE